PAPLQIPSAGSIFLPFLPKICAWTARFSWIKGLPLRSDKRENHAPLTARRPGAPAPPATLNAQGSEVSNSPVAAGSGINHSVSSRVVNENFGQPAATAQAQAQLGRVAQASYQCSAGLKGIHFRRFGLSHLARRRV